MRLASIRQRRRAEEAHVVTCFARTAAPVPSWDAALDRLSPQNPFEAIKTFTNIDSGGIATVNVCDEYHYTQDGAAMQKMIGIVMSIMHFGRGKI